LFFQAKTEVLHGVETRKGACRCEMRLRARRGNRQQIWHAMMGGGVSWVMHGTWTRHEDFKNRSVQEEPDSKMVHGSGACREQDQGDVGQAQSSEACKEHACEPAGGSHPGENRMKRTAGILAKGLSSDPGTRLGKRWNRVGRVVEANKLL
jgi:hypothetical protein